jgi:hypothetical protein
MPATITSDSFMDCMYKSIYQDAANFSIIVPNFNYQSVMRESLPIFSTLREVCRRLTSNELI